ncbi:MAG: rhomboid family intramembrane serine protease [Deltaproteobacteria bacterium]|nr:rhomboid family intramembrane serine protease [Deltaproteobacteria bacterium]
MAKLRITYNAPVVLTFAILAAIVFVFPKDTRLHYFAAHPQIIDTSSYLGLVTHILGHASWEHLLGNFMLILLLGPILEERHGSMSLLIMILITALVTGLINLAFSSNFLLGASGVVFMMILLASTANIRQGEIPLTFIAIAVLYLGGEIYRAVASDDNVSRMAHLIGGLTGAVFGFIGARAKSRGGAKVKDLGLPAAKPAPPGASKAKLKA